MNNSRLGLARYNRTSYDIIFAKRSELLLRACFLLQVCSVLTLYTIMGKGFWRSYDDRYPAAFTAVTNVYSGLDVGPVSVPILSIRTHTFWPSFCPWCIFGVHDPARHSEDTESSRLSFFSLSASKRVKDTELPTSVSCDTTSLPSMPSQTLSNMSSRRVATHFQRPPISPIHRHPTVSGPRQQFYRLRFSQCHPR
jgi:hypothetical protein